jgi:beta-alanine--pyruvate transaminase
LAAAVELEPVPGKPGARALHVFEAGLRGNHLFRFTGDTIAMAPPFVSTNVEIEKMVDALRNLVRSSMKSQERSNTAEIWDVVA